MHPDGPLTWVELVRLAKLKQSIFLLFVHKTNSYFFNRIMQAYMVELYQDTLVDLLLPRNSKRMKLEIKKDQKVTSFFLEVLGNSFCWCYFTTCIWREKIACFKCFSGLCFYGKFKSVVFCYDATLIGCLIPFFFQGMVSVENTTVLPISSYEDLRTIIVRGSERRHTSGTQMNEESSRSHLILSIVIESTNLQTQSVARGKVWHVHYYSS